MSRTKVQAKGCAKPSLEHDPIQPLFEPRPFSGSSEQTRSSSGAAEGRPGLDDQTYLRQQRLAFSFGRLESPIDASNASIPVQPMPRLGPPADPVRTDAPPQTRAPLQTKVVLEGDDEHEVDVTRAQALAVWLGSFGYQLDPLMAETLEAFVRSPKTFPWKYSENGATEMVEDLETDFVGQAGYMTGDMYGICASMLVNPNQQLRIYVDETYYPAEYAEAAAEQNQTIDEFYQSLHNKPYDASELKGRMKKTVETQLLSFYYSSGVDPDRIWVIECANAQLEYAKNHKAPERRPRRGLDDLERNEPLDPQKKEAHRATERVREALKSDPKGTAELLRSAWLGPVDETDALGINQYYKKHFASAGRIVVLWGRISGKTPGGAHPELDSNMIVMAQLVELLHSKFSGTTVVLAGDEVIPKKYMKYVGEHHLVKFWRHEDFPNGGNRHNQLYLLDLMRQYNGACAIGMRSGAMEGPALLGMPTIYLDDSDCDERAGDRMELWAGQGAYERTRSPEETPDIEHEKAGPLPTYKRVRTEKWLGQLTQYKDEMNDICNDIVERKPARWPEIVKKLDGPVLEKRPLDKTMKSFRTKHYRISATQVLGINDKTETARLNAKNSYLTKTLKFEDEVAPMVEGVVVPRARNDWRRLDDKTVDNRNDAHTFLRDLKKDLAGVIPPANDGFRKVYNPFWAALDAIELGRGELEQVELLLKGFGLRGY